MSVRQVIAPHAKSHGSVHNTTSSAFPVEEHPIHADRWSTRWPTVWTCHVNEVVSVYRTPAYNARCPGAKSNSYHLLQQRDGYCLHLPAGQGGSDGPRHASAGLFKGGVGRYGSFTHIDTRGTNADW